MDHQKSSTSPAKKIVSRILRALLVVAILVWIYSRTDAGTVAAILKTVSLPLIAAAAALATGNIFLQGIKWWVLIRRFVPDLRLARALSVHLESTFYAIALPSALAQDVLKSVMLSKSHAPEVVWAASWLGRLIALASLLIYSVLGAACAGGGGSLPAGLRTALIAAAATIALLCALSFSKSVTRPLGAIAAKIAPPKIIAFAKKLRDGIYAFRREYATLTLTFLISAAVQLFTILFASIIAYAVSGNFYFVECLVFVPLIEVVAITLPLTPGGVGVREALMALLFTRLGFSEGQAASYVTISLLLSMVRVIGAGPPICRWFYKSKS